MYHQRARTFIKESVPLDGMRIYHLADDHGDLESLERCLEWVSSQPRDSPGIICHSGDSHLRNLYSLEERQEAERESRGDAHQLERILCDTAERNSYDHLGLMKTLLDATGLPWLFVPGNYDPLRPSREVLDAMHYESRSVDGLLFAGGGGFGTGLPHPVPVISQPHIRAVASIIAPYDEREFSRVLGSAPDIVLTHTPAYQTTLDLDPRRIHVGDRALRAHLATKEPALVLSGHMHFSRVERFGRTVMLGSGNLGRFSFLNPETLKPGKEFPYGCFSRVTLGQKGGRLAVTGITQYAGHGAEQIAVDL